jgi:hypothetical protein
MNTRLCGVSCNTRRLHEALEHGVRIDPLTGLDAQSQPVGADQLQATRSGLPPLRLHNHLRRELNERRWLLGTPPASAASDEAATSVEIPTAEAQPARDLR